MSDPPLNDAPALSGDIVAAKSDLPARPQPTAAGQAALGAAQMLGRKATAPETLRAYKADWTHYAAWCAAAGLAPVPAEPATVGAYHASHAESHAPTTVRRRLSAIGKMHRFNDLPWNPGHRDIQGPLQGLLRTAGRCGRRPPSRSRCCASSSPPATLPPAAGATALCC